MSFIWTILKKNDFLKISLNIASFCKTLKGHNSDTVGPFELKFCMEA